MNKWSLQRRITAWVLVIIGDAAISVFNPGYSCSLIGGLDAQHMIE